MRMDRYKEEEPKHAAKPEAQAQAHEVEAEAHKNEREVEAEMHKQEREAVEAVRRHEHTHEHNRERADHSNGASVPKKRRASKKMKIFLGIDIALLILVVGVASYSVMFSKLELKGDKDYVVNLGEEFNDPGTTSRFAKASGNVDTNTVGDYVVTYTRGNKSIERNVHVVDPSKLVIGIKGSQNTLVKEGDPYIESGAYLISKDDGPIDSSEIKVKGEVDTSKPGDYKVKYTGKSGYITKAATRKVTVVPKDEFKANTEGVPVLMYHYVYTANDKPENLNINYILDTDLEEQLKYLNDNGYYFPSFTELRAYADGKIDLPEKSVILTFDDAQWGFLSYGIPMLEKYKVPATSFVIGVNDGDNKIKSHASQYIQYQSHSYNMHRPGGNIGHGGVISALSHDEIVKDLQDSFKQVGNSNAFAYPFGDVTDTAKAAVADSKVECAFSTQDGKVKKGDDFRAFTRVRVSGTNSLNTYASRL